LEGVLGGLTCNHLDGFNNTHWKEAIDKHHTRHEEKLASGQVSRMKKVKRLSGKYEQWAILTVGKNMGARGLGWE
jgi:hypothetical protein